MAQYPTVVVDRGEWPRTFNLTVKFSRLTEEQCKQLRRFMENLEIDKDFSKTAMQEIKTDAAAVDVTELLRDAKRPVI